MSKELREYHYEFVKGRARPWRVGDYEDDPVTDFPTEDEARAYVEEHNRTVAANSQKRWGDHTASNEEQYEDYLRTFGHPVPSRNSKEFKDGLDSGPQFGMTRDPVGH